MNHPSPLKAWTVVVSEWLLVLPAALLLAAAALRQLQPPQQEPARTIGMIFGWIVPYISRAGAAVLFLGLPGIVVITGCTALLRLWRQDEALRQDVMTALAGLRRHAVIALITIATLLAGSILTVALVHVITD